MKTRADNLDLYLKETTGTLSALLLALLIHYKQIALNPLLPDYESAG